MPRKATEAAASKKAAVKKTVTRRTKKTEATEPIVLTWEHVATSAYYIHLEAGGDTANLRGWLFTVAANACRDRMRRRLRWLPWTPANEPSVEPAPLRDEDGRLRAARDALRQLAPRDRLLLTLRAQGLSYREISTAARIRGSSVGRLLARAVDRWERASVAAAPLPHVTGDRHEVSR